MAIGVRVEPELEQQLDQLAERMGKSSQCLRTRRHRPIRAGATTCRTGVTGRHKRRGAATRADRDRGRDRGL